MFPSLVLCRLLALSSFATLLLWVRLAAQVLGLPALGMSLAPSRGAAMGRAHVFGVGGRPRMFATARYAFGDL